MSVKRLGVQRNRGGSRLGAGYKQQVLADAPLGYWRLDETSGTTIFDSSGNGHDGTMTGGGFSLAQPGAIPNTDPDAKSIKWTGSNTYVLIPQGSWMDCNEASWEFWINPGVNVGNAGIFSRFQNGGGGSNDWLIWYNVASQVALRIYTSDGQFDLPINWPQIGKFTHIVGTYDGATLCIYVDSELITSTAATGTLAQGACDISIGTYQGASGFGIQNHFMDEVAFYGTALSSERVTEHYQAGVGIR